MVSPVYSVHFCTQISPMYTLWSFMCFSGAVFLGVYQGPLYWLIPGISHLKILVLCLPQPTLQTQATWVAGFPCLCVCVQPLVSFLFLFCFFLCMTWPPFKHLQPWILPLWAFLTLLQPYWTIFLIYPGLYTAFFSVWNFIFFLIYFFIEG